MTKLNARLRFSDRSLGTLSLSTTKFAMCWTRYTRFKKPGNSWSRTKRITTPPSATSLRRVSLTASV
jgi:hypothetical protein